MSKNITISAKPENSRKSDFIIEIPHNMAKALLKNYFDGSYYNLTNNLQIDGDK
jgi:hypothetical protein